MIPRVVLIVAALAAGGRSNPVPEVQERGLEACLEEGSLECVQDQIFRGLRSFFGQESAGVAEDVVSDISGAVRAADAEDSGRSLGDDTTSEDKRNTSEAIVEGRGKKLKKLLPLLLLLKIPFFIYGVLAYVVVTLIAKAALLKGSLALGLTGVFLLRHLLAHHPVFTTVHGVHGGGGGGGVGYSHSGGGGYAGGGGYTGAGGYDSYTAAHADQHKQYSHNVAYKAQHQRR